jgi:hypothetical protein
VGIVWLVAPGCSIIEGGGAVGDSRGNAGETPSCVSFRLTGGVVVSDWLSGGFASGSILSPGGAGSTRAVGENAPGCSGESVNHSVCGRDTRRLPGLFTSFIEPICHSSRSHGDTERIARDSAATGDCRREGISPATVRGGISRVSSGWRGSAVFPAFCLVGSVCADCAVCTDCAVCADCAICAVFTDCAVCAICADCAGCVVCAVFTDCAALADCAFCAFCSVCADCAVCTVCAGCAVRVDCVDCAGCVALVACTTCVVWSAGRVAATSDSLLGGFPGAGVVVVWGLAALRPDSCGRAVSPGGAASRGGGGGKTSDNAAPG